MRQKSIIPYVGGGGWGQQNGNPSHPPSPRGGIVPKIGGFCMTHQFESRGRGPWRRHQSAKWAPRGCKKTLTVGAEGVTWPVWCGVKGRHFPVQSSIKGYIKKTFSQNRGGKPSSTLLQCQSLPTSFPRAVRSEYPAYIVAHLYISRGRGLFGLSWHRFILQATSLQRTVNIKNKAGQSSTCGTVRSLLFSPWKVLLHTVYIFNIFNVDWG
jgi:hypothetical protein